MKINKAPMLLALVVLAMLMAGVAGVAEVRQPQSLAVCMAAAVLALGAVYRKDRSARGELAALVLVFCLVSAGRLVVPFAVLNLAVRPAALLIVPVALYATAFPPREAGRLLASPYTAAILTAITLVAGGLMVGLVLVSRHHSVDSAAIRESVFSLAMITAGYLSARSLLDHASGGAIGAAMVLLISVSILLGNLLSGWLL